MTDLTELAGRAYIYGFPMVYDLDEAVAMTTKPKTAVGGPVNRFAHATALGNPNDKFVSLNNDTLYSIGNCDVTNGPLVLHLPDIGERYRVMQFVDAWTNNFAYLGTRATGNGGGLYLLAGPGWSGDVPEGMSLVQAPTNVFTIVGRHAVDGAADVPNVVAVQKETWLTPLSDYPNVSDGSDRKMGDWDLAPYDTRVGDDLVFWEKFRSWLKLFPPPAQEDAFVARLEPLGLLADESPYIDPDPALAATLIAAQKQGHELIVATGKKGGEKVNGWSSAAHLFDYNRFALGPGTIDSPEWQDCRFEGGLYGAGRGRRWRTLGKPRLRGVLRLGVRRRRRAAARWRQQLCHALRCDAAGSRILVGHDVRHTPLLSGGEPHRPLFDRRPHARPGYQCRRFTRPLSAAQRTCRPERQSQLAAHPGGRFPPTGAHLPARSARCSTGATSCRRS